MPLLRQMALYFATISLCSACQPSQRQTIVAPPMPRRAIAPTTQAEPGQTIVIDDQGTSFTLFIPENWKPSASGETVLTVNFHGTPWFVIQEHLRRGLYNPVVACAAGEGSAIYRENFEDPARLARVLRRVEEQLKQHGAADNIRIAAIDISSFSAGYGAVREIVKNSEYVKMIRRIVLCDSMYAGWDPATTRPGATSRPAAENIEPWIPFAKMAARGEKVFVLTHSMVPTSYANTAACAAAMIEAVGAKRIDVPKGSDPATLDLSSTVGSEAWNSRDLKSRPH